VELYHVWRILVARKWLLIWLPIVATCSGLGLTYVLPEQYESSALVLVRPFQDIKFDLSGGDKKEFPDFPVNLSAPIDAPSKTYIEVIKSPAVAMEIVSALQLHVKKPKKFDNLFETLKDEVKTWVKETTRSAVNYAKYGRDISASPFDLAVEAVEKNLVVSATKDTYAFAITYRSSDPEEAAAVANMAGKIFLERSAEAYRSESARAGEFLEKQLDESRKALEQARAAILAYKNSGGTFELNTEYNEQLKSVSDLKNALAKTEVELAGRRLVVSRTQVRDDPVVISQTAQIAELKEQISNLQEQLAAYPKKETRMNAMNLAERLAKESYEFYLKKYEQARARESATVTEIRIASRAVPSLYPVKPLKYVYAGLSFATAMLVAIGWALLSKSLDPRLPMIRELEYELEVPVLGAIPKLSAPGAQDVVHAQINVIKTTEEAK
jgi:uncharacterized protein involved in exopolysaccharide biosynthesis